MKKFLPIILGSDENAYGSARLFNEAYGQKPLLLCERELIPTKHSSLFTLVKIENFGSEEVFADALFCELAKRADTFEQAVVVPCSDYYASLASRYYGSFSRFCANSFISPELLAELDTKDRFYALCDRHSLSYPKTYVCEYTEREGLPDKLDFAFPIVVKPENSNAYDYLHCSFEGKKKVYFFNTPEQYYAMIREMNKSSWRGKLIVQEFIPGGDDAMRVMNTYSDNNANVRAMCLGQPVLEEYAPKTLGNYAAVISRCDEEIYIKVKRFLEEIGYVGFANIDMKYDSRTGRYMMLEINPRLGRSSYFVRAAGLNMMKLMTDDCVFGQRRECVFAENTALWYNAPRRAVIKYVKNEALRSEIKQLFRRRQTLRTLVCPGDMSLARRFWVARYYFGQGRNFKRYFFDKRQSP